MIECLRGIALRIFALLLVGSLSVQAATAQTQPTAPTAATAPTASATVGGGASSASYRLGVADRLRLTVFNEPALSGEFTVSPGGDVSLPLIGNVPATGRSVAELQDDIQHRLADGYLRDPKVAIDILSFRPFYILGEVSKPGEYPFSDGLTVMNAVATAQGFTYRANKKYAFVKHRGETEEKRVPITADLQVVPGDTIRIGERYF
jgi:protein involved in polysaccharide export with SLBB domain